MEPLDLLKVNPDDASIDQLSALQKFINKIKFQKKKKLSAEQAPVALPERLPQDHPKYLMTLKLVNAILTSNNLPTVPLLTDAKQLFRDFFIAENANQIVDDLLPEILTVFTKHEIALERKFDTLSYLLTLLKAMIKNIGYNLVKKTKRTQKNNVAQTHRYYGIV